MIVKRVVVLNLLARELPHRPDDLDVRIGGIAETDVARDLHPAPRRDPRQEVDGERGRALRGEQFAEPVLLRYPHQQLPLQVPQHGLLRRTVLHPGEQFLEPASLIVTWQVTVRCISIRFDNWNLITVGDGVFKGRHHDASESQFLSYNEDFGGAIPAVTLGLSERSSVVDKDDVGGEEKAALLPAGRLVLAGTVQVQESETGRAAIEADQNPEIAQTTSLYDGF